MSDELQAAAHDWRDRVVDFAQRLVRTPSISGEEGAVADLMLAEMRELGYDDVFRDRIGNVVGVIRGTGGGRRVLFNTHLDHVDPGRRELWAYEPYGAEIADGKMHGRATSDIKGPGAAQVYGAALLVRAGRRPAGDVVVTGVVQEEPAASFGMRHLCDVTLKERNLWPDVVVIGEPTARNLYLGHRGRVELEVTTYGRTSHGSAPWRGINAVYKMLPVIEGVRAFESALPEHPRLGRASIALTIIGCSPGRLSVVPDVCTVCFDRRTVPGETPGSCVAQVEALLQELTHRDPELKAEARVREVEDVSYTGLRERMGKIMPAWLMPEDDPDTAAIVEALHGLGHQPDLGTWAFGTDGGYTAGVLGLPTFGYAPGDEACVHTPTEYIAIDDLVEGTAGNAAIALRLSTRR
ncbi:MAG: YgeY family selenium metabolism-linked hydrolase [Chloroflexi bacterium]|nr:YgeY family selenium metabolism-linked hydrolase [Chloroflexota bacterium]